MTKPFDPKAAIKAAKGHERILAYTGFDIQMEETSFLRLKVFGLLPSSPWSGGPGKTRTR